MALSDEQNEKFATMFGLGLAAIGTFNVGVSSFVYNVMGGSLLTILFILLFIFIIWMFWNRGKTSVNESAKDKIDSEKDLLRAERELKEERKKGGGHGPGPDPPPKGSKFKLFGSVKGIFLSTTHSIEERVLKDVSISWCVYPQILP